ncbi:MAG TPA: NBR1-Ig-like domain-containing protein [Anaerolineales bacterium]|nr:NBR1-Ig-like domain-containing protein [Anaerolineales bacterium]
MTKFARPVSILFIIIFILAACNLPSSAPATEDPNAVFTAAALTVQAMSTIPTTQVTPFSTPTLPPPAATNTSVSFPTLALPTSTRVASPTAVCDQAQFVRDVTIPDGTTFAPNATFTKTWRLRNAGTCTWSGYSLVFDSGDSMGGTSPTPIGTVSPGQEIDVSVNLTAPATAGSYRGYWRIRNSSGVLIPVLGGTQGKSFFVDIRVGVSSSGLDLHTRAPDASWVGSAGVVTFGGPETDANGFAMYRNNRELEDGSSPAKVLEIHPQFVNNGVMTGLYPSYTVVAGEHFKAKVGFLAKADGSCGVGNAKFQLNYKEAGVIKPLGEWSETCDGTLKDVDVDLTSLAGKNVQIALAVLANGPADEDSAVWISPRIELP